MDRKMDRRKIIVGSSIAAALLVAGGVSIAMHQQPHHGTTSSGQQVTVVEDSNGQQSPSQGPGQKLQIGGSTSDPKQNKIALKGPSTGAAGSSAGGLLSPTQNGNLPLQGSSGNNAGGSPAIVPGNPPGSNGPTMQPGRTPGPGIAATPGGINQRGRMPGATGGPGGNRGMGGFGPGGGGHQVSVASLPAAALQGPLGLNGQQVQQISQLQQQFQEQRRAAMPARGDGPPDFGAMQAARQKTQALEQTTSQQIERLLSPGQRNALPIILGEAQILRSVQIPAELLGSLGLTQAQFARLKQISSGVEQRMHTMFQQGQQGGGDFNANREAMQQIRQQAHASALAVLSGPQQTLVSQFEQAHPRRGRGGFGPPGEGGPPPGEGGGPPPGEGGPPPDSQ